MKKLLLLSVLSITFFFHANAQDLVNLDVTVISVEHNYNCGNDEGVTEPDPRYLIDFSYSNGGPFTNTGTYSYLTADDVSCGTINLNDPLISLQAVCANQVRIDVEMWEEDGCGMNDSFDNCDIFENGGDDDDNWSTGSDNSIIPSTGASGIVNLYVSGNGGYAVYVQVQWTRVSVPSVSGVTTLCQNETFNLTASTGQTVTGANFYWYDAASGGNLLFTGANYQPTATSSTTYYVSYGTASCKTERVPVAVTVNPLPAVPTGNATQLFCNSATIADLVASGTLITWYDSPSAGSLLSSVSALYDGQTVYAEDDLNGCASPSRLQVDVSLFESLAPAARAQQNFCSLGTVADLVAAGDNILWYDASTSGTLLNSTDALTNGTSYFAEQTVGGCVSTRTEVVANLVEIADQTLSATDVEVCLNGSTTINIASSENGVVYYLRDNTNDTIVDGPIVGDGNAISFATGNIGQNMEYNVFAEMISKDAVDLSANNDFIEFATPFTNYESDITVESWVYFDGTNHAWAGQSAQNVDAAGSNVWLWHDGVFYVNDAGTWRSVLFPAITSAGWVHVATVANSSGLYIYYDGVEVATSVTGISTGIQSSPSSIIRLGHDPRFPSSDPARNSSVIFDNFKVWNKTRTENEILNTYNDCFSGPISGLVQYTLFEEGTGSSVVSLVGSDAVMTNTTTWVEGSGVCQTYNCSSELAGTVTVSILDAPTVDVLSNETACDSYNLVSLTNGDYYTESGGTGTMLNAGNTISADTTLYIYASNACGTDESQFDITIITAPTADVLSDTVVCQGFVLPTLAAGDYYDATGGTGNMLNVGDSVLSSQIVYVYASNTCGNDESNFNVTVNPFPTNSVSVSELDLSADQAGAIYQWLDCDNSNGTINGETAQVFTASANGNYAVEINLNGCIDTSDCVSVNNVSLAELMQNEEIKVYPNPTEGNVTIDFGKTVNHGLIRVLSPDGRLVQENKVNGKQIIQLEIKEAKGVYFIELISDNKEKRSYRIVKQ